jgi:hypothetical protein
VSAVFFVDRISDGIATLLLEGEGDGCVTLPIGALPDGVREGDVLRATFGIDRARADAMRDEIRNLMDGLGDDP